MARTNRYSDDRRKNVDLTPTEKKIASKRNRKKIWNNDDDVDIEYIEALRKIRNR